MILWTSWFLIEDKTHREEVRRSIELNLDNPLIQSVNVLCEIELLIIHPKLNCISVECRPTFQTIVDMFDNNQINIITNSDIVLDYKSTEEIAKIPVHSAYCITRYQLESDYKSPISFWKATFATGYSGISQDVWVINRPKGKIICDFFLGIPGCDNRFTLSLYQAGLKLINPGGSIVTYHVHSSPERNYTSAYYDKNFPGAIVRENTRFRWQTRNHVLYTDNLQLPRSSWRYL
jgi:hypothetical protein